MTNEEKKEWGGARPGAGRPATGRKKRNVYVTDAEFEAVKNLIEKLREECVNRMA
ncbi:MAG: hypothetical protein KGZ44_09230 [Dethiobacter sp.]|nr:hypothetical protein [Dethiobacter sp.]